MKIDWISVRRVLVIRLRSIGDTVLSTPSLVALRRHLPDARIDILLEDWVAPLLDGFGAVDDVITIGRSSGERLRTAWQLRRKSYDVVFNLHGGTTATFLTRATGARHRVGYAGYQYARLHHHLLDSSAEFWGRPHTHSAEQQLALLGHVGIPVDPAPRSSLAVTASASASIARRLAGFSLEDSHVALLHPAAAFATKQWATENFARIAEFLDTRGIRTVAVAAANEKPVLDRLQAASQVPVAAFSDLSLPEITALASRASVFVGNDSGIAHIAAAVETPSVVIFGSSNRNHWYPWTGAPSEMVFNELPCQPCAGYTCEVFGEPRCILSVQPDRVAAAVGRMLALPGR